MMNILPKYLQNLLLILRNIAIMAPPLLWIVLFIFLPIIILLRVALSEPIVAVPPFSDLITWHNNRIHIDIHLENFLHIFQEDTYFLAIINSFKISGIASILSLLIGYPIAYFISIQPKRHVQQLLLLLIILPFWTSFVIRAYAWMLALGRHGLFNQLFMTVGIIDQPIQMLNTQTAVIVGIVYSYLPYVVFPIYNYLNKMDKSILEAAHDLGGTPLNTMRSILIPLSGKSIIAGWMLVFIPGTGEFLIPSLLGGNNTHTIGQLIWNNFFSTGNWPVACALSFCIIIFMGIPFYFLHRAFNDHY